MSRFETDMDLTVTENAEDGVSFSLQLALSDDCWYDFTNPGNRFTVQHEELGLPYYCVKAYVYAPGLDGYSPYDYSDVLEDVPAN